MPKLIEVPKTEEFVAVVKSPMRCPRCDVAMILRPSWDVIPKYGEMPIEPRWECGCGMIVILPRVLDSTMDEIDKRIEEDTD